MMDCPIRTKPDQWNSFICPIPWEILSKPPPVLTDPAMKEAASKPPALWTDNKVGKCPQAPPVWIQCGWKHNISQTQHRETKGQMGEGKRELF